MKWISLSLIAILTLYFWPESPLRSQSAEARNRHDNETANLPYPSTRTLKDEERPHLHLTNEALAARITKLARRKLGDPRDPKVIEFIRLLREYGARDEAAALALVDLLSEDPYVRSLEAKMAVTGGWALRDPEAATRALLTEGAVLPSNFRNQTSISEWGVYLPQHVAIMRQASYIFEAWKAAAPGDFAQFAHSKPDIWDLDLSFEFSKHLPPLTQNINSQSLASENTDVQRNSIDAILNHPNRTSTYPTLIDDQVYDDLPAGSEPAYTYEEWAARNPRDARAALSTAATWRESDLLGISRVDSDFAGLLALTPPDRRLQSAETLIMRHSTTYYREIWPLDGRESTWQLSERDTQQAIRTMINESSFSHEDQQRLRELADRERPQTILEGPIGRFLDPILSNLR